MTARFLQQYPENVSFVTPVHSFSINLSGALRTLPDLRIGVCSPTEGGVETLGTSPVGGFFLFSGCVLDSDSMLELGGTSAGTWTSVSVF